MGIGLNNVVRALALSFIAKGYVTDTDSGACYYRSPATDVGSLTNKLIRYC